jgi:hypothetical protein
VVATSSRDAIDAHDSPCKHELEHMFGMRRLAGILSPIEALKTIESVRQLRWGQQSANPRVRSKEYFLSSLEEVVLNFEELLPLSLQIGFDEPKHSCFRYG